MRQDLTGTQLKDYLVKHTDDLPSMPHVMERVIKILKNPNSSLKDLAAMIEIDQGLAIKALMLANSAFYRRISKVYSIQEAAILIGMRTLGDLIKTSWSLKIIGDYLNGYETPSICLWRHSIAVAIGARILAEMRFPGLAQDAFCAGLIHDSGKIIMDPYIVREKNPFKHFLEESGNDYLYAEKNALGFDHADLAARIFEKWNLPKTIVIAIRYHHTPAQFEIMGNDLVQILHVADKIVNYNGLPIDHIIAQIDPNALQSTRLEKAEIQEILHKIDLSINKVIKKIE